MQTYNDILNFLRTETLRDIEDPLLWSDESLCEFISQANDEFAEEVHHIRDSTSIAASFKLEAGVDTYELNQVVLAVMTARVDGADYDLTRVSHSTLDGYVPPPDTAQWLEAINYGTERDGTPLTFSTDESVEAGVCPIVRVWPTPALEDDGKTVRMRVIRLPLVPCSMGVLDKRPEIPRPYIMALVHGAAARAYSSQDAEGEDSTRSVKQRGLFMDYIARAKRGVRRKMFQPLAWGFGRGGFSHSR